MDIERHLSAVLHEVADREPPAQLVERTLHGLPGRQQRGGFARPFNRSVLAAAAGIGALVVLALALTVLWAPDPLPPADAPTPTPTPMPVGTASPAAGRTPPECPAAQIRGTLIESPPGELALVEVPVVEPVGATPLVVRITWEPAFFTLVEDQAGRPAIEHASGLVAFVDDDVLIGGGENAAGWYACGSLEVLSSPVPDPTPVVDVDDRAAWRALVALDRLISPPGSITQLRRIEWIGDTLHLEFSISAPGDAVEIGRDALRRAGLSGTATASEAGPAFVALAITDARSALAPLTEPQCGTWWQMRVRPVGDGADLAGEQLAAAGEFIRGRAEQLHTSGEQLADVIVSIDGGSIVVEMADVPPDIARNSLLTGSAVEFAGVPEGSEAVAQAAPPPGLVTIFGGAGIAEARLAVDLVERPAVDIELRPEAAQAFDDYAAEHQGGQIAVIVEGVVVFAPSINAPRFGGDVQISGRLDIGLLQLLTDRLRVGVDVLEFELIEDSVVERDC